MTRSEIIELSNQLSERKGERVLNLQSLYRFVVQDICKRQRFWWRRISVNLTLTPNQTTYDLTTYTTTPALTEILFEEITKIEIILTINPFMKADVVPIFDPGALIAMQSGSGNMAQPAQPARYTMNPGDYKTILIDAPDIAYSMWIVGWAMPNPASDSTSDAVPLIPPYGHNTIVAGIMSKVFKFAYGSKNEKTLDAMAEYEQGINDLQSKKQFDPNFDLQMNIREGAVRST